MRLLLVIEVRFQHIQTLMFYQHIMLENLLLVYVKKNHKEYMEENTVK